MPNLWRTVGIKHLIPLVIYLQLFAVSVLVASIAVRDMQEQTRGVTFGIASQTVVGVNTSLEQYARDDDMRRAFDLIRGGGFGLVRQHFYWNQIEPRQGEFQWDQADRMVTWATEYHLGIIAVLDTSPPWARSPNEQSVVTAPPTNVENYGAFVTAFVQRYGHRVRYVQLWDNPNVHPYWGLRVADPIEYTALLKAGAAGARAADAQVQILSAGLAPNRELIRGHPDYSDILFLREMYQAGAREYFDILAAKPYGLWTGPEDRRVGMDLLNFSRALELRDEMVAHGDAAKPMWAVEFGWSALPTQWEGIPSPWGSDTVSVQSDRLARAVQRARSEWPWMTALVAQAFHPDAQKNDPTWGLALVDAEFQPRLLYTALAAANAAPAQPAIFDFTRFYMALAALGLVALAAVWRGAKAARRVPWREIWRPLADHYATLPEWVQSALPVVAVILFYYSPNTSLNVILLALVVVLFALRFEIGLTITVFTIPFYLFPKNLAGSMQFSLVELLTLGLVAAWVIRLFTRPVDSKDSSAVELGQNALSHRIQSALTLLNSKLTSLDWAVIFFVFAALVSVKVAANFGVASREFRIIVLEPALLYALVRAGGLAKRDLYRLVNGFLLSALAVSLIGLYQYVFTDYVIIGEGVRRILAVYGSPNNPALYLERALPLLMALALFLANRQRRIAYALAAGVVALCIYFTWSRGAWLLGLPAGLLVIGLLSGKRVRLAIAGIVIIGILLLIPFLGTERAQSLFQTGTGTGFFRVSVWQAGAEMIRDHPVWGVGLDNFLYEYPNYMKPDAWREPNLSHPHNVLLDFWARLGIPGIISLGWMLVEFYRRGLRGLGRLRGAERAIMIGLLAGMAAALAHGLIDAAFFFVDLAFVWMLMLALDLEITRA